jgi:DNA-binding CsgD family transcriptional regulator
MVQLLADGKTSRDIGEIEGLATITVQTHIQNAMRRTGASNSPGLVAMALRKGWIV